MFIDRSEIWDSEGFPVSDRTHHEARGSSCVSRGVAATGP